VGGRSALGKGDAVTKLTDVHMVRLLSLCIVLYFQSVKQLLRLEQVPVNEQHNISGYLAV
jgi:hypothetical protein